MSNILFLVPRDSIADAVVDRFRTEYPDIEFRSINSLAPQEEIQSIFVKSDYKLVQIELKNILYIEGLKDYIKIYEENNPKPILSLMSMKAMEDLLPASRFMRVHRSYIVQKDKIRVIDRGRIVFGKAYIPISDSYKQIFQDFLEQRS